MIWNNWNIRINNKPVFYKRSYELFRKKKERSNILEWIGLGHSVPLGLRNTVFRRDFNISSPTFKNGSGVFDVTENNSRD